MATPLKYTHLSIADDEDTPQILQASKDSYNDLWKLPLKEVRARRSQAKHSFPSVVPLESDCDISYRMVPVSDGSEIEIKIYKPVGHSDSLKTRPLFYACHGGGWVAGNHETGEGLNRIVCVKCQMVVISVDYRQAPEFTFPTAINDAYDVLIWVIANPHVFNINPDIVVLGGGSAGGNLAACLALRARDNCLRNIVAQVLAVPVICHPNHFPLNKYEYTSYDQNTDAPVLNSKRMRWFWDQYVPNGNLDPYHSPLLAQNLGGLPPTLIHIAGLDPLRDEAFAYAEALKKSGCQVTTEVYPGLPHGFYHMTQLKLSEHFYIVTVQWLNALETVWNKQKS